MSAIRSACGEICETRESNTRVVGKEFYDVIEKEVDCQKMFACREMDATSFRLAVPPRMVRIILIKCRF